MKKFNRLTALMSAVVFLSSAVLFSCKKPELQGSEPADVTVKDIQVSNADTFEVGYELTKNDFAVKKVMTDGTKEKVNASDFSLEIPEANLDEENKLCFSEETEETEEAIVVKITYKEFTKNVNIVIESKDSDSNDDSDDNNETDMEDVLPDYFKKYLISSKEGETSITGLGDWGSGATNTKNEDGTFTLTASGAMWGGIPGCVAAVTGIPAGEIAKYEYIVAVINVKDFEANTTQQGGNYGFNLKIPETQIDIGQYAVTSGNNILFQIPVSAYGTAPETANEMAFIFGGEGSVLLKEVYFAAENDPNAQPVTGITLSASSDSVNKDSTVVFTVKTSKLEDVTSEAVFEIVEGESTGAQISENVLTSGNAGTVKVKVTYTCDDGEFTAEKVISVVDADNLITTSDIMFTYFSAPENWDGGNTSNTAEMNGSSVIVNLDTAPNEMWKGQVKIHTDADIANGEKWIFTCKVSENNGNIFVKINDGRDPILGEKQVNYFEEGTEITLSGTATADVEDIDIMFGFGPCDAGTAKIENIFFGIVNE